MRLGSLLHSVSRFISLPRLEPSQTLKQVLTHRQIIDPGELNILALHRPLEYSEDDLVQLRVLDAIRRELVKTGLEFYWKYNQGLNCMTFRFPVNRFNESFVRDAFSKIVFNRGIELNYHQRAGILDDVFDEPVSSFAKAFYRCENALPMMVGLNSYPMSTRTQSCDLKFLPTEGNRGYQKLKQEILDDQASLDVLIREYGISAQPSSCDRSQAALSA